MIPTAYIWNHEGYYYDSMPYVWKNMAIKKIDVMYIIDCFSIDDMVSSEDHKVIEGR